MASGHSVSGKASRLKRPEPVDERGDLKEATVIPHNDNNDNDNTKNSSNNEGSSPGESSGPNGREHPPPPRLSSLHFPTDRLPQLGVEIVKRLPGVGQPPATADEHDPTVNHNVDPSLPLAVEPEKVMFNLWENTQTQTEVKWRPPENKDQFSSICYELQLKNGDADWTELAQNRLPLYRIYYVDGVAIFGRQRISQETSVKMLRLRVRAVGENSHRGKVEKKIGPWSDEILFSMEGRGEDGCEDLDG